MATSWPKPSDVLEHYRRSIEALWHLKATLLNDPLTIDQDSRFFAMTPPEIHRSFDKMTDELDIQINFVLIASCEAALRVDFQDRINRRGKDYASRQFRLLDRERKAKAKKGVRIEDILKVWAEESSRRMNANTTGSIGKLLLYRHWVAHGRYWPEKKSGLNDLDPLGVYETIRRFLNSLPGFEILPAASP